MSRAEEVVERVAKRWMEDDDYDPHDHETRQAYYRSLYFVARALVTELGITAEMVKRLRYNFGGQPNADACIASAAALSTLLEIAEP